LPVLHVDKREIRYDLRLVVLEKFEVIGLEIGYGLAFAVRNDGVNLDEIDVDTNDIRRRWSLLLW
jgi:hypothetical protein